MKNILRYSWRWILAGFAGLALLAGTAWQVWSGDTSAPASPLGHLPRISPDYTGLVIPPNIAPLNFLVQEPGAGYRVVVRGQAGNPFEVRSRKAAIELPEKSWAALLNSNRGQPIYFDVYVRNEAKAWRQFAAITNSVAAEEIDPFLIYRKLYPFHNSWSSMGIFQRDLRCFAETPLLENRRFENDCCHCHSLANNNPNRLSLDIRSATFGNSLLVVEDDAVTRLSGTVGFAAWHPNGRLLASSFNKPQLILHSRKNDMRDIVEFEGWLGYLHVGSNVVQRIPGLMDDSRLLTGPVWSPDGKWLYFCSGPRLFKGFAEMFESDYQAVKYDLQRIAYDPERGQWGAVETIYAAQTTGLSAAQPRVSPDGRWLSFCLTEYGCWPTYHPGSDLYIIDLQSGAGPDQFKPRRLEASSDACESWHTWSANSRWIVFSSKRGHPLFNRPYLAYVDAQGRASKGFILPQRDPAYYDSYLKTYTIPTLAKGPVTVAQQKLVQAIRNTNAVALVIPSR